MPIDPSISLNAQSPNAMSNLNELAGTALNLTGLKKAKATMASDIAQRAAESRAAQANANVAEQTQQPLIAQQQAVTQTAQTGAANAAFDLQNKKHQQTINILTGLIGDQSVRAGDPQGINAALSSAYNNAIQYGSSPEEVQAAIAPIQQLAKTNPQAVQPALINMLRQGLGGGGQAQVLQPSGPMINTGQVQYQANTNPLAATPQGPVQGTGAVNQIPVGTQVFNPNTNAPMLIAAGGGQGPQSGPALGAPEAASGVVGPVNEDWQKTNMAASTATQNIGILRNIKSLSDTASTGAFADRRALGNKILGMVGISANDEAATNTDVLAKNAAMLALAGGNTDSARALAEIANPNIKMTPDAIKHAVDQIVGQQKLSLAKQKFMQQYAGNPQQYSQALSQFNQVADPRVFELAEKTGKEQDKMLESMTPQAKADLAQKMRALHNMGIEP
jgi:hypothetical protein